MIRASCIGSVFDCPQLPNSVLAFTVRVSSVGSFPHHNSRVMGKEVKLQSMLYGIDRFVTIEYVELKEE
ncbi:uncharacterized protein G2W53_027940 [Senna tora]|uniref:Uncharacterized protein n=1 Tax=Senna tora TaxID=362788 RepID=A0A834T279_9FABA|nr:uncharacterized protein G2W53_027940 [Senna tora]